MLLAVVDKVTCPLFKVLLLIAQPPILPPSAVISPVIVREDPLHFI